MPSNTTAASAPEAFHRWTSEVCPFVIEYSRSVLAAIHNAVVDAYYKAPHGGIEIGGLLFGRALDGSPAILRIEQSRPIACEHANGPGFLLSAADLKNLERQIAEFADEESLQGLELVGWYHSHHRSGLNLTAEDIALHDRLFPELSHVALVLRPSQSADTRAVFYHRSEDGTFPAVPDPTEFTVPSNLYRPSSGRPIAKNSGSATRQAGSILRGQQASEIVEAALAATSTIPEEKESVTPVTVPLEDPPPLAEQRADETRDAPRFDAPKFTVEEPQPPAKARTWLWVGAVAAALLAGLWIPNPFRPMALDQPPVTLRLFDTHGLLRAEWQALDRGILDSPGGELEILDGDTTRRIELSPSDLRSGSVTYSREAGHVRAFLRIPQGGGRVALASAQFLGEARKPEASPLEQEAITARDAAIKEAELNRRNLADARRRLDRAEEENGRLTKRVQDLENSLEIARRTIRSQGR